MIIFITEQINKNLLIIKLIIIYGKKDLNILNYTN
jgi:hypothetical protein